jgi:hypothetical protein
VAGNGLKDLNDLYQGDFHGSRGRPTPLFLPGTSVANIRNGM